LSSLQGQIERITFSNQDSGYTIAKLKVYGHKDLVTVVGTIPAPTPGEILKLQGEWTNHPRYGEQFKVVKYATAVPATVYGIQKYLGSGLIKGIGPVMAKRIVQRFGKETLTVIERDCQKLKAVAGIGDKRVEMIEAAWAAQKEIREVMLFLQSHGVSSAYATKIFKAYGDQSIAVVKANPYRLATDIFGIGFITADRIAEKLGFARDSAIRAQAGILFVLHQLADEGHVYYPYDGLVDKSHEILDISAQMIRAAIESIACQKLIVVETLPAEAESAEHSIRAVYLAKFHLCETSIASNLKALKTGVKTHRSIQTPSALAWVQKRLAIDLADRQKKALMAAIDNKILIITGGPGTGKTTIIRALLMIFRRRSGNLLLAAPTGRAAKRMSEATNYPAKTIHRLLEYNFVQGGFQRNADNPLDCDLLVVDEASMIDTILMHHLLKAIPSQATFILVGDVNQLPSVGAGSVLKDIIASAAVPVVELNEIFRQARSSRIIVNAHRINNGRMPDLAPPRAATDFYFIAKEDPHDALQVILKLARERIPQKFGLKPRQDIQVLTPMHKGIIGAGNLNLELQRALNPDAEALVRGNRSLRLNDKVMQIKNNYDKEVFNGDIGIISAIDQEAQEVMISYDGREVNYDLGDLDEVVLAYAVSVHKAQGSEYPAVIIPLMMQHYILLQRNLIYTAVTRGRKLVVVVGTKKALAIGIGNDKTQARFTALRQRLAG
jgi:exodeoxyribonuclease V alpha subunit